MHKQHISKIIAFVGMPGAGKTSAIEYLVKKNIPKVYVLDLISKLDISPKNEQFNVNSIYNAMKNAIINGISQKEEFDYKEYNQEINEKLEKLINA